VCVCLKDYETVDHMIWHCERFETALTALDVQLGTPGIGVLWTSLKVLELVFDDLAVLFEG
jgi:hypothetical protein